MDSTLDRWRVVCTACVIALAACSPQNNTKQCSANGQIYFCPEGTQCGGVQMLCVRPGGCGNGVVEEGEDCDDGNVISGDGCSPTCRNEVCGNHIIDPGEICDDGNTVSGDGCSSDCKSDESCGNLNIDRDKKDARGRGEVCDDGNNIDGDGCSADCRSTEICGNGFIDVAVGEVCDDGPGGSANCSTTCRSNLTCNNFNVDPGEECDHGLFGANNTTGNDNANDCRKDCVLNRCGDGFIDSQSGPHHEECDGAPKATANSTVAVPTETATCNIDCTLERCGDGKVNKTAGEQCDDSNAVSGDGCSADCKLEFCGDGIVNNGEACDRALTPSTCNLDCTISVCGDGKLNTAAVIPEQCDDHNTSPNDGCSPLCQFEHCGNGIVDAQEECDGAAGLQPCSATCHQERCGNGIRDQNPAHGIDEQCDDGNLDDNDGCSHLCVREFCGDGKVNNGEACDRALTPATCNIDCTPSVCGDHKINTAAIPPEQCDDGGTTNGDGCSAACTFEHCGNGVVDNGEQCDGPLAGLQPCSATCHQEICGNGILDQNPAHGVNEQCDDGNTSDNDGCSHLCRIEFCGDSIVNNGEACDRALTPATCNIDCTLSTCGDGKLNLLAVPPEQCDDAGTVDGDGCSHDCKREFCGDGIVNNGEACDFGLTPETCNLDCTSSRCGDGKLNTRAVPAEQCDDGNALSGDGCSTVCRLEHCGNGAVDSGEECDGLLGLQPCSPICRQERCGNGILEVDPNPANNIHEQCDDGNTTAGDGCSASCQLEHCGNGVVDPGEQCDGPLAGLQPCSASCRREICGNGILDRDPANLISEECDDGNTDDNDGCSAACVFEFCGDGLVNNHEVCDAARTPATCNLDCTASSCGDGVVNPFAIPPEQCDDHNAVGGDGCSATCQTERCGNGILDPGETCDGAIGPQPCSAHCQAEVCGNGIVDLELDEQCDDSNTDDNDGCSHDCKLERCGDGIVNNHETCDRALTPATCNLDCTTSRCGDGKLNTSAVPAEQCDDGNSLSGDGCSSVCRLEHCGNGVVDNGEECDGLQGLQPCSAICHQERCGNGIVEVDAVAVPAIHEQCDNGSTGPNNNDNTHSCTATCQVAVCGDGFTEAGVEQCDDGGNNGNNKDCTTACRINVCGDGLRDSAVGPHFEACDNGQDNTDDPVCPYNTSCVRCSTTCTVLVTVVPTCGDGIVHGPQEVCDDHNTDACGSCSAGCAAITSQRAIGFIVAVSGAQLADGETLTLDDGVNPPVVFEFDDDVTIATDHVAVAFTAADDATTVRQSLITAITSGHPTQPLLITATAEGSVVVSLTHARPTSLGNQAITESVANPLFLVIGMQGGAGGDCDPGTGCETDDDCTSHSCDVSSHTCDAPALGPQILTSR